MKIMNLNQKSREMEKFLWMDIDWIDQKFHHKSDFPKKKKKKKKKNIWGE